MHKTTLISIRNLIDKGEACLQTGPFGTQLKASQYATHGIPVINVRNIGFGKIREADLEYLNESMAEKLHAHVLRIGDIVFGRKGAVERHVLIDAFANGWIQGSDCLRLRIASRSVDQLFLSYYLQTKGHQEWMNALCSFGATMTSLNHDIVNRITFPCPPITIQRKIAAILSSYDDLIENNKRRIALLEKMAAEIYREWFVRMRFPGYQNAKFVKGLPLGWEMLPFSDVVNVRPREETQDNEEYPFVPMENLSTSSMYFDYSETRLGSTGGARFRNGDVIFPRITPSVENGKRGFVMCLPDEAVACGSTEFIVFRGKILDAEHIYMITCMDGFRKNAEQSMVGASGRQRVSESCFSFFLVPVPPKYLRDQFQRIIRPIFKSVREANEHIKRSCCVRDLLLGRLISGQLSVDERDIRFPPSMTETL